MGFRLVPKSVTLNDLECRFNELDLKTDHVKLFKARPWSYS